MKNRFNHKMLEIARNSRGLTQTGLAELLPKLNQPNLSKIERGELPMSEEAASMIAKALDFPIDFFYQEEVRVPFSHLYFRKRLSIPIRTLDKIFADIHIVLKGIDNLLEEIELKEYPRYVFDITEGWTPEAAASRMREILGIHPERPVTDVITRIEEQGIAVFLYDGIHEKFDGLTAHTDNGTPVIVVNKNMSNDRMKFTLVHELFHLVLHIPCSIEPWRDVEREANIATGAFYLPRKYCYRELQNLSYNKLGILKNYWGVSKAAIVHRAKEIEAIRAETYKYLMIELGRRGERKVEQGHVEVDNPRVLRKVIELLKSELQYTDKDLAVKTRLSLSDYHRFFDPQINKQVRLRVVKSSL